MAQPTPASAGSVDRKPDPELLRRLEAERDQAREDRQRAEALRKQGAEKIRRGKEMQKEAHEDAKAELCRIGALPASECP